MKRPWFLADVRNDLKMEWKHVVWKVGRVPHTSVKLLPCPNLSAPTLLLPKKMTSLHFYMPLHFQSLMFESFPLVPFSPTPLINRSLNIWSQTAILLLPVIWGNSTDWLEAWNSATWWQELERELEHLVWVFFSRVYCKIKKSGLILTNVCLFYPLHHISSTLEIRYTWIVLFKICSAALYVLSDSLSLCLWISNI